MLTWRTGGKRTPKFSVDAEDMYSGGLGAYSPDIYIYLRHFEIDSGGNSSQFQKGSPHSQTQFYLDCEGEGGLTGH